MKIGLSELILIFVVALFVIGPDKLPEFAGKLGKALAKFKEASSEVTADIKKNVTDPLEEAQKPLKEAIQPLKEIENEVNGNIREVKQSLNNIGKTNTSSTGKAVKADVKDAEEKDAEAVGNTEKADAEESLEAAASEAETVDDKKDAKEVEEA